MTCRFMSGEASLEIVSAHCPVQTDTHLLTAGGGGHPHVRGVFGWGEGVRGVAGGLGAGPAECASCRQRAVLRFRSNNTRSCKRMGFIILPSEAELSLGSSTTQVFTLTGQRRWPGLTA